MTKNIYTFEEPVTWPITALSDGVESYVDIDFDGKKTASDVKFDEQLFSNSYALTPITTMIMNAAQINVTTLDYNATRYLTALSAMGNHFGIETKHIKNATPQTSSNRRLAILSDAIVQAHYQSDYNASNPSSVESYFNRFETFYNTQLTGKNVSDSAKYHEALLALQLIDAKLLHRFYSNDTAMVPDFLNGEYADHFLSLSDSSYLSSHYNTLGNLAYWDIALDTNHSLAYVAAGNDGFDLVDISAPSERLGNYLQSHIGFGTTLTYFDKNESRCIVVASQDNELQFYSSTTTLPEMITYGGSFQSLTSGAKAYDVEYMSTNALNLEYLLIAEGVAGLKILDTQTFECNATLELNATHTIGSVQIGTDTHGVSSSNNRKIIYIADGSFGVKSIDISGASPALADTIALTYGTQAYDIHLAPNSSEVYVSTDRGIEIFNSDDTGALSYLGAYLTEGSRANLLGESIKVDRSQNAKALFVADNSGGLKILDISQNTNVKLCGVVHFGIGDIAQRSAVRDIKLDEMKNGEKKLYIANDANGLIVIDDVKAALFEHCKGLLD